MIATPKRNATVHCTTMCRLGLDRRRRQGLLGSLPVRREAGEGGVERVNASARLCLDLQTPLVQGPKLWGGGLASALEVRTAGDWGESMPRDQRLIGRIRTYPTYRTNRLDAPVRLRIHVQTPL